MKTLLQSTQVLIRTRYEGHLISPFHVCMQNLMNTARTCAVPHAITRTTMQICSGYAPPLKLLRQTSYWFVQIHSNSCSTKTSSRLDLLRLDSNGCSCITIYQSSKGLILCQCFSSNTMYSHNGMPMTVVVRSKA